MKNFVSLIMAIVMVMSICTLFASCEEEPEEMTPYYLANAEFFYSYDKGHSYGNGTKEYYVGETVYMKLKAAVTSNVNTIEPITIKLTIPNITAVSSSYFDGQPITPTIDIVKNVTVYEFTIPTNIPADSNVGDFVFQFVPNSEARVTMLLEFDDKVDAMYDKANTVLFVMPEETTDGE